MKLRLVDDKGRLLGLINVIDLLALLLVVAVIARFGAGLLLKEGPNPEKEKQPVEVLVLIEAVRQASVNAIQVGDQVIETKTNFPLGEITETRVEPAKIFKQLTDGTFVEQESSSRFDVWVTVTGPGRVNPNVIMLGNQEVRVGTSLNIRSNRWAVIATVMGMNADSNTGSGR